MNSFQSPALWIAAIIIAAVGALLFFRNRNSSSWGFKDVVKNPEYWSSFGEAHKEADFAAQAAKHWSDDKVDSAVKKFVLETPSSQGAWNQARTLGELGERTHSTVLGLLRDPALYNRLVKPTNGKDALPEAPFNRACDLLGDAPKPDAVAALAPFLDDPSEWIRQDAAMAIAKTGADTITPFVRKAFADPKEYVRSYALMGLEFALNRSNLAESVQADLFSDVLALLRADRNADKATDILYRFDTGKATEFFLSQEVFTAESPIVHEVLEVLANEKVSVSRDALISLIASLEQEELEYSKARSLGEALRLLGQQQHEEDRNFLQKFTTLPEERVAQGAAAGLLCSFGLEGFEQRIWDLENRSGYEALSEHQRLYSAVFMCDAEINNGGLAQYFVNSSGDQWRDALDGFKAMGLKERLDILTEAIEKFGNTGPSTDRNIRQDQLSKLYKRDDSIFDALDSRYYDSSEVIEVFTSRFVLNNPESFR